MKYLLFITLICVCSVTYSQKKSSPDAPNRDTKEVTSDTPSGEISSSDSLVQAVTEYYTDIFNKCKTPTDVKVKLFELDFYKIEDIEKKDRIIEVFTQNPELVNYNIRVEFTTILSSFIQTWKVFVTSKN
jgi:hypothetical protein